MATTPIRVRTNTVFVGSPLSQSTIDNSANTSNAALLVANAASLVANTAYNTSVLALSTANNSGNVAQSAYDTGNSTLILAEAAFGVANNSGNVAQSGHNVANTGLIIAQAAYDAANTNSTNDDSISSTANAAVLLAQSAYDTANTGNTTAQAAFDFANNNVNLDQAAFDKANTGVTLAQASYDSGNTTLLLATASFNATNTVTVTAQASFDSSNTSNTFLQANDGTTLAASKNYTDIANTNVVLYIDGHITENVSSANSIIQTQLTEKLNLSGGNIIGQLTVTDNVHIGNNLSISGDLFVLGNTYSVSANNLSVTDSMIFLASDNPANLVDIGIVGEITQGPSNNHTGLVRDHLDNKWKLFSNVFPQPTSTVNFDVNTVYDTLKLGNIEAASANINNINLGVFTQQAYTHANASYATGNAAYATGNASFTHANTTGILAASSFDKANVVGLQANAAYATGNASYTHANGSYATANAGYATANAAYGLSNTVSLASSAAFGVANNAQNTATLGYTQANAAYATANAGYATGNGSYATANAGYVTANAAYATANAGYATANAAFNKANGAAQVSFTSIVANGSTIAATSNADSLSITAAAANGISVLNPSGKIVDFGLLRSGVTPGTYSYPTLSVDSFGRTTAVSNNTPVLTFNTRNGAVTLSNTDITTALGYTPANVAGDNFTGAVTGTTLNLSSYVAATNVITNNVSTTNLQVANVIQVDSNTSWEITPGTYGYRDIIGAIDVRGSGVNNPSWTTFRNGINAYEFNGTGAFREVWVTFHINHDYAPGTPLYLHTHWATNAAAPTGNVQWQFEYTVARGHNQEAFPATSTVSVVTPMVAQYQHMVSEINPGITSSSIEPDSLLIVRIFRDPANTADTSTSSAWLFCSDIHYQANRWATKNRAPNFYA